MLHDVDRAARGKIIGRPSLCEQIKKFFLQMPLGERVETVLTDGNRNYDI